VHKQRSNSRFVTFALLFGVTGFLGLPLLWFSKHFSIPEKITWSILNILYSCFLIGMTAAICWWAYDRIFSN
jgi:hypothetical protein